MTRWVAICDGLRRYFNRALPLLLLYRNERPQYAKLSRTVENFDPCMWYGLEHLLRLLVKVEYLISAADGVTEGEVRGLVGRISEIARWIGDNIDDIRRGKYRDPHIDERTEKDAERVRKKGSVAKEANKGD